MFEYVVCVFGETEAYYGTESVKRCLKVLQVFKTRQEADAADAIFCQCENTCVLHVSEIHTEF